LSEDDENKEKKVENKTRQDFQLESAARKTSATADIRDCIAKKDTNKEKQEHESDNNTS
jgi:hypothetical protein